MVTERLGGDEYAYDQAFFATSKNYYNIFNVCRNSIKKNYDYMNLLAISKLSINLFLVSYVHYNKGVHTLNHSKKLLITTKDMFLFK